MIPKRRCAKEPYKVGEPVGEYFSQVVSEVKKRIQETDDNLVCMCFGQTGAGKTTLGFHFGDEWNDGGGVDIDRVGFDKQSWAKALSIAREERYSFLMYDEANVSKRDAMSSYNKDTIDLLFAIRGLNLAMWFNNPSLNYLDRIFLDEGLVRVLLFC